MLKRNPTEEAPQDNNRRLVEYKLKGINRILYALGQELVMENVTDEGADLRWERPGPPGYIIEEHVFGGEWFELFVTLNGIEYGMRMMKEGTPSGTKKAD